MVIKVSKQLLAALEISDAVGMSSCHCFSHGVWREGALEQVPQYVLRPSLRSDTPSLPYSVWCERDIL
jgi:hypothetical protein